MKTGRKSSFWELYNNTLIKIPQIQRDYVQGRKNAHTINNLSTFIKEIVDSLCSNKKMSLNFIYGYYDSDGFIPIDGQQRLTTLFLLHFYVLSKAGHRSEMKLNFSYETRYTTNRFFKVLFESSDQSSLDKESITNSPRYVYSWNHDPSIISCLAALDKIEKTFPEGTDWEACYERLTRPDCPITFMLLEIDKDKLGKPNQLYIRMNSRGKQLTDFENFKASLYAYIDESANSDLTKIKNEIRAKIDGDWQDTIWYLADNDDVREKYSDKFYRDLIHWVFVNRLCVDDCLDLYEKGKDWLKPNANDLLIENIYLENYIDISENSLKKCIEDFCHMMNLVHVIKDKDKETFNQLTKQIFQYSEDSKGNYNYNLSEYKQRVMLMALTSYGKTTNTNDSFNVDNFKDWLRIFTNLTNNTEIDDPDSFYTICKSINGLDAIQGITNDPKKISKLNGFAERQITEEIFKQNVINNYPNWKNTILKAESNSYFQGEILFSFLLTDITDPCNIPPEKFKEYTKIWNTVESMMKLAHDDDVLFHRALLTYGDYSINAPGGAWKSGIKTFYQYSEKHHNYDWRGMLRPKNMSLSDQANIFAKFLKDCICNRPSDIAEKVVDNYQLNENPSKANEIRYYLIKYPQLFDYCKKYYYIWHDYSESDDWDRYLLMKTSKRNTYAEIMAYILSCSTESIEFHEGGNPYNHEDRRSYAIFEDKIAEYRKGYFIDKNGNPYQDDNGNRISRPEGIIEFFEFS